MVLVLIPTPLIHEQIENFNKLILLNLHKFLSANLNLCSIISV